MDGSFTPSARGRRAVLAELEAQITELAGQLNAAQYRWLMLIAEFDRLEGWSDGQLHSCAHWLNFKCGLNLGAAREKVRVAHALAGLPKIAAAMARGELSYSKVRAVTRVACAATEEALLMIALHGTAYHVENLVRGYRQAQQAAELSREAQQHVNRSVSYEYAEDGSLVLKARLPAVAGALVIQALKAALERIPAKEISATGVQEHPIPYACRRADALASVAESFLAGAGSSPASSSPASSSPSTADRYQVIVHVDAESLREHSDGRCEIEQGPSIPIETARRLACDASLLSVLENEHGEPLDVGRKTRSIPPAIRRALRSRDAGCRFPGCTHQQYVDAHHIEHWADGGETKLSNLVTLCRVHHRLVHEGQIRIETPPEGGWRFVRPDGRHYEVIRRPAPAYTGEELATTHTALGIHIDRDTAATRWRGERMNYELGVWILCQRVERARRIGQGGASSLSGTSNTSGTSNASNDSNASNVSNVSNVSAETSDTVAGTGAQLTPADS
jgi:Domain of unknown function (DUF222)/HNH endonuclease